jgi:hypothetical protein
LKKINFKPNKVTPVICFMIDAGWYSCVAMLLSSEKPRKMYLKAKTSFGSKAVNTLANTTAIFGLLNWVIKPYRYACL